MKVRLASWRYASEHSERICTVHERRSLHSDDAVSRHSSCRLIYDLLRAPPCKTGLHLTDKTKFITSVILRFIWRYSPLIGPGPPHSRF